MLEACTHLMSPFSIDPYLPVPPAPANASSPAGSRLTRTAGRRITTSPR
jgi:hypothetical protein